MDDEVWVPTVFSKHRERLIAHDAVVALFNEILAQAQAEGLLSGEHFSVDGACQGTELAGTTSALSHALHPDIRLVAEYGRTIFP